MRVESSVTSVSWIPREAIKGYTRLPWDLRIAHHDLPPPDVGLILVTGSVVISRRSRGPLVRNAQGDRRAEQTMGAHRASVKGIYGARAHSWRRG
jgi:hypothetical protein